MKRITPIVLFLGACSTLGTPASPPGPLPHGGTGQFRPLTGNETGLSPSPTGLTLSVSGRGLDGAMAFHGHLFYAAASALLPTDAGPMDDAGSVMDAGPSDAGTPSTDASIDTAVDAGPIALPSVNWARYQGRQIFHSVPGDMWGFAAGTSVLSASEPWEGGYVTHPWVVQRADGRVLLYYAAEGGIGVASAASIDGPFVREGSGPIVPASSDGVPSHPCAIDATVLEGAPAAMMIYYELGGAIHLASSSDGIALTDMGVIATTPLPQRDDRDGDERAVGAPGAITVPTPAGRHVVRMYYESRRHNGVVLIGMLGSGDGVRFDEAQLPVFAERDRQHPAPRYVDARTTLLYTWIPNASTGAIIASVTPAGVRVNGMQPTPF